MSELSELPSEECSSSESVFVGYRQELVRNRKTKYNVNGRDIVIFYLNGNFHAMDQRCYRKYWKSALIFPGGGTPLQESNGDVPLDGVAFSRLE